MEEKLKESLLTSIFGPLKEGPALYIGLLDSAMMSRRDFFPRVICTGV